MSDLRICLADEAILDRAVELQDLRGTEVIINCRLPALAFKTCREKSIKIRIIRWRVLEILTEDFFV